MDLVGGDPRTNCFAEGVSLVTSKYKADDVMACSWFSLASSSPALIAVFVGKSRQTCENITKTKEFGVNISADNQNFLSSIAGGYSARDYDKIAALKELGVSFYKAKKIKTLMIEGCAANFECKLHSHFDAGDHVCFLGEIVELNSTENKPLVYSAHKYWKVGEQVQKPNQEVLEKMRNVMEKHKL